MLHDRRERAYRRSRCWREIRGAAARRDLPTHGGRLFAYVYDPAVPGLDELAARRVRAGGARQRARPDRVPVPAGDGERAGRRGRPGCSAAGPARRAGRGRQRHQRRHRVADPGREGGPGRPPGASPRPRLVVPATAHAAFAKAAHYLRVALDVVPVDPATLRADPAAMAAAIGPETVLVACSAPSYAHGVVDPVARDRRRRGRGRGALPRRRLLRRLDPAVPAPARRRRCRRSTSPCPGSPRISVDLHKYAYARRASRCCCTATRRCAPPQYFAYADWPGYTMINPVIASTRSGGPIAAAYATLRHLGDAGYLRLAGATRDAVRGLAAAVPRRRRAAAAGRAGVHGGLLHRHRRRRSTCSSWPTSWPRAAGTPSPSCRTPTCPPAST